MRARTAATRPGGRVRTQRWCRMRPSLTVLELSAVRARHTPPFPVARGATLASPTPHHGGNRQVLVAGRGVARSTGLRDCSRRYAQPTATFRDAGNPRVIPSADDGARFVRPGGGATAPKHWRSRGARARGGDQRGDRRLDEHALDLAEAEITERAQTRRSRATSRSRRPHLRRDPALRAARPSLVARRGTRRRARCLPSRSCRGARALFATCNAWRAGSPERDVPAIASDLRLLHDLFGSQNSSTFPQSCRPSRAVPGNGALGRSSLSRHVALVISSEPCDLQAREPGCPPLNSSAHGLE